jgi:hypothetical protein
LEAEGRSKLVAEAKIKETEARATALAPGKERNRKDGTAPLGVEGLDGRRWTASSRPVAGVTPGEVA